MSCILGRSKGLGSLHTNTSPFVRVEADPWSVFTWAASPLSGTQILTSARKDVKRAASQHISSVCQMILTSRRPQVSSRHPNARRSRVWGTSREFEWTWEDTKISFGSWHWKRYTYRRRYSRKRLAYRISEWGPTKVEEDLPSSNLYDAWDFDCPQMFICLFVCFYHTPNQTLLLGGMWVAI